MQVIEYLIQSDRIRQWGLFVMTLLLITLAPSHWSLVPVVRAATITVDADCTLAEAITSANADSNSNAAGCAAGSGADTINITAAGTTDGVITLSTALPFVTTEMTINGNGYTLNGNDQFRIFQVWTGDLTLNRLTLTKARINGDAGGAIYVRPSSQLTLRDSTLIDNRSSLGGAGIFAANGDVTIERTAFIDNIGETLSAGNGGGAIILTDGSSPANPLTIRESAFIGNSGYEGGAIRTFGSIATIVIENSTFHDNTSAVAGGAIYHYQGDLTLRHVTMVGNTSSNNSSGSQLYHVPGTARTAVYNSIIHGGDSANDCDLSGNAVFSGNLSSDGSCLAGQQADPRLGSLVDRRYFPLLEDSPAIDAANGAECNNLHSRWDQRGQARPSGSACDIGAIEFVQIGKRSADSADTSDDSADTEVAYISEQVTKMELPEGVSVNVLDPLSGAAPQAQQVNDAGVGNDDIIDVGYIEAVDIYGYIGTGVQVCFEGSGEIVLLDAATSPRQIVRLNAVEANGMTCVTLERAGTVILMTKEAADAVAPRPPSQFTDCNVTTTHVLNFRASPGGEILQWVLMGATLTALQQSPGWFQVDLHGEVGWISADYVTTQGDCD